MAENDAHADHALAWAVAGQVGLIISDQSHF